MNIKPKENEEYKIQYRRRKKTQRSIPVVSEKKPAMGDQRGD